MHPSRRRQSLACAVACASVLAVGVARAGDPEKAEALFKQGRAALETGDNVHACELLQRSVEEDPGGGALLNLAYCHQLTGKNWLAWRELHAALELPQSADRRAFADRALKQVEKKLPHVELQLGEVPPLRVELDDGTVVAEPTRPFPVEPGKRSLTLSVPGKPTRTVTFFAPDRPGVVAVIVAVDEPHATEPAAAPAPPISAPEGPPPSSPPEPAKELGGRQTLGLVLAGVGVAAAGAGTFFGLRSFAIRDAACSANACTDDGVARIHGGASTTATLSTAAFAVAIATLAGGAYLLFATPATKSRHQGSGGTGP